MEGYWDNFYKSVDCAIEENFWGNLDVFRKSKLLGDPYVLQLESFGYNFGKNNPHPARLRGIMHVVDKQLHGYSKEHVLRPGKAFSVHGYIVFFSIGEPIPDDAKVLNLLEPHIFVSMLADGYFPIGDPIRKHTNQTLTEHDLAHMSGFISNPTYMSCIRQAFRIVDQKARVNKRIANALKDFNSLYSLRLYYVVEVLTEISDRDLLSERLQPLDIDKWYSLSDVQKFLLSTSKRPVVLYRYLSVLYGDLHSILNAFGGESRDLLNRRRKHKRRNPKSSIKSKFYGNSIYSQYLNARRALENIRSNHVVEFHDAIVNVHAPLIYALLGTAKMTIEEFVLECVHEVPRPESMLFRYMDGAFINKKDHLMWWAFCSPEYDKNMQD